MVTYNSYIGTNMALVIRLPKIDLLQKLQKSGKLCLRGRRRNILRKQERIGLI